MSQETTFADQARQLSESVGVLRGQLPYGRKIRRETVNHLAQYGPVTVHTHHAASNSMVIQETQDVEPILKHNREQLLSGHDGYTPSREMRKVASIPLIVVEQLRLRKIDIFDQNDWPKVAAWLDSPEAQKFRTAPGTISKRPYREYLTTKGR